MTVIGTNSNGGVMTAYSNQRKVARCQNGVLWAIMSDVRFIYFHYSTDNGATWNLWDSIDAGSGAYAPNCSIFIDLDDNIHVVYKHGADGYIYYVRGTPNAARTAWTWSAATLIDNTAAANNYPDIVAHREGTGWKVHIVWSWQSSTINYSKYKTVTVTSGAVISVGSEVLLGGSYEASAHTWPSIDFNHTGDGKTVAGGTPHLYVAWSAGATGAGKGIRFKKATYSAGAWTWGTEREINTGYSVQDGAFHWLNCLFDGTRVVLAGFLYSGGADPSWFLVDRDAADTGTVQHHAVTVPAASYWGGGSMSYDENGNVYLLGRDGSGANGTRLLTVRKWARNSASMGTPIVIESSAPDRPYISAKRGYSNSRIEFVYTDGTASPYSATYGSISLNADPNVPTNLAITSDVLDTTPVFSADISDPDSSQPIKARFTIYQSDGVTVVGTVDSTLTAGAHTATKEYASALPVGQYFVAAATVDDANAVSAQTAQVAFSVKTFAEEDLVLLWETDELITVDLQAQWDVLVSNQKDFSLVWNVYQQAEISLELEWSVYTPWVLVDPDPESPVIWEEVRA